MTKTGTSKDVLTYYHNNWDKIANCYNLDKDNIPIDPAWYRRRLYNNFLDKYKPKALLDIGCGGGWTVLDALKKRINAIGVEPVNPLQKFASNLLNKEGFEGERILLDDLLYIESLKSNSQECIALLSVIPHVPADKLDHVHFELSRVLKPGGKLVVAYRNELFDFFTFNSITLNLYKNTIWNNKELSSISNNSQVLEALKNLVTNPNIPGEFHTNSGDKSFGKLKRFKTNPLTIKNFLAKYNFNWLESNFYHFHCVPPLISDKVKDLKKINHKMELNHSNNWRAQFMCPMYLVICQKN